jgi:hypothetical protein
MGSRARELTISAVCVAVVTVCAITAQNAFNMSVDIVGATAIVGLITMATLIVFVYFVEDWRPKGE